MTKSACLLMLSPDIAAHHEDIAISSERYLAQKQALQEIALTDAGIRSLSVPLNQADALAEPILPSARQIAAGAVHAVAVTLLLQRNQGAAQRYAALARQTPSELSTGDIERAIYATGELRVRSQQILRDMCLLRAGIGTTYLRAEMLSAIEQFDAVAERLIVGDAEHRLPKAPNVQIKLKMKAVQKKWSTLSGIVRTALEAPSIETGDITLSSVMGDSVLKALDQVLAEFQKL